MIISRWILFGMRNLSDKFVDGTKTHILCSKCFSENRSFYEIMWKNMLDPEWSQMTVYYDAEKI
jgi:hypothetical protein